MYQTTQDFIATSKAIKEAFLLSLLLKKPLRIKTARIGVVPMVPCTPYATFVNDRMVMQAYDPAQPVNSPNRTLKRSSPARASASSATTTASMTSSRQSSRAARSSSSRWPRAEHRLRQRQ